jgi:hypothetical protein
MINIEKENDTKIVPLSSQIEEENNCQKYNKILWKDITTKYIADKSFIEWCKKYISLSPNTLQNIIDTTGDIIIDNNRMEVVDIPNMILLIISIIQKEAIRYDIVCSEHIISLTKIIMYTIIDYELFVVSPILQNNLVVEAMINSCLELAKMDLSTSTSFIVEKKENEKNNFWDWITNIFCFWKY